MNEIRNQVERLANLMAESTRLYVTFLWDCA